MNLRTNNFDLLRLLLALVVVFFHIGMLSQNAALAWFVPAFPAKLAVQAFFVVSGFLIVMSYEHSRSLADYAWKRALRILPAYVLVIVASAVLGLCLTELSAAEYLGSPGLRRYLLYNLSFFNYRAPDLPGLFTHQSLSTVNGALWTLKIEVTFYMFVPILVWLCRRAPTYLVLGVVYALSVAYGLALNHCSAAAAATCLRYAKQFPGPLAYFAAGAGLYYWWKAGHRLRWPCLPLAVLLYWLLKGDAEIVFAPLVVGVAAIYFALYLPYLGRAARYGDFSYGVYILHFPIVQTYVSRGAFAQLPVLATLAVFATTLLAAFACWHLVEHPALGLAHRRRGFAPVSPAEVGESGHA